MKSLSLAILGFSATLAAQTIPEIDDTLNGSELTTVDTAIFGSQIFASINAAGDFDYYRFVLSAASDVRFVTGPGFVGQVNDTVIDVFSVVGGVLSASLGNNDDEAGGNRDFYSDLTVASLPALASGDYYVLRVRAFGGTQTGSYVLDSILAPPSMIAGVPDVEVDDPVNGGTANATACNTINTSNLAVGGAGNNFTTPGATADYDVYQFTVPSAGTLILSTSAGAAPAATDTVVYLADAAMTQLATDDDGGPGLYSLLSINVTPGVYHAVVAGWGATSGVGNVVLNIVCVPAVTSGVASWTAQPGGCTGSAGIPTLDTRAAGFGTHCELPFIGSEFSADLINLPAFAPYFRIAGFSVLPVPIDLSVVAGAGPGCIVEPTPTSVKFRLASATGDDFWGYNIPYSLGFIGLPLHMQAIVLDGGAIGGLSVSNRGTLVIGTTY